MAKYLFIAAIFLFSTLDGLCQLVSTNTGLISFRSDAPLELITASSKDMKGRLDLKRRLFAFSVKMNSFKGFNSPLQREHFNENYMESELYPDATFSGKIIEDLDLSADGIYSVRAKGNLTIHGVTKERIIKSDVTVKNGKISIQSAFTVLLSDHNIPVPKVVHEKLASEIKVEVKADLTQP